MTLFRLSCFFALCAAFAGLLGAQGVSSWDVVSVEEAPVIDGDLSDGIWARAGALSAFRQVEPVAGGNPSEATEVFLAYDAEHLYFAVRANDRSPSGIVATQLKRDAELSGDDHFTLVLDPYLDRRNGFYFSFNALGARNDALIRGGTTLNTDWDGIWEVVTQRTESGWVAEGAIPLSTISFKSNLPAWGLNLERYIARSGERLRWHGTQRQYLVNNLANAGRLEGLSELRRSARYEFRPFSTVTFRDDSRSGESDTDFKPGFDLSYKLTESTTAVVTVNTDFADAEVDDRVVNLTRFPVRFPEKRAFFLQDAGVFSYSLINNNPLPYYSRRIGLGPRGEIVDIVAGARISGREGPVNFGLLGVRTEATEGVGAKELGVGRVLFNLSNEASVGMIGTYGDPRKNGDAWLLGADFNYTTGDFLGKAAHLMDASLYYQTTDASGLDGDGEAYGWGLKYDSPTWGFVSYLDRVGNDYYPALGRVQQTGVSNLNGRLDYEFNPDWLKSIVPTISYNNRHNLVYHDREQLVLGAEVLFETQRGDTLLVRFRDEQELLPSAFSIGNGVLVLPGDFSGQRKELALGLSKSRPISASFGLAELPYYGGKQTKYSGTLTWRPSAVFNFDGTFEYTGVELPYARFPVRLVKASAAVQFSKDLVWSALGQFDSISESVGFNTRLRWTYAAGSDVYLVFNHGIDASDDRWESIRTEISAKVGASYRF